MKFLIALLVCVAPLDIFAQISKTTPKPLTTKAVQDAFAQQLKKMKEAEKFTMLLVQLDSLAKTQKIDTATVNALKETGAYTFLSSQAKGESTVIIFDIQPFLAQAYIETESSGKIDQLKILRAQGLLKLTSRIIANDIELPRKTNANQSYNDFYLQVIKEMMTTHRETLAQDNMNYQVYLKWEAQEQLKTEEEVRKYREEFIRFLYQYYHIN